MHSRLLPNILVLATALVIAGCHEERSTPPPPVVAYETAQIRPERCPSG